MNDESCFSRRAFLVHSAATGAGLASAAAGWGVLPHGLCAAEPPAGWQPVVQKIADPGIRAGVEAAIAKNLLPAATEQLYPGSFNICADGAGYGGATWPGLDSWQMAGAYLLVGRSRLVLDYFEFVRASQRKDGNVPFAIFPEMKPTATYLRGLKHPDDVFTYEPPKREGLPASSRATRKWIGLFEHWQPKANPLSTLAPVSYILTASEIFTATGSLPWLRERLPSIESAAKHLLSRTSGNGLIAGSGFYIELPPRYAWDGVTQCYVIHAFRETARLCGAAGEKTSQAAWSSRADTLARAFVAAFWREDHFGEYVHPERGLVDSHGLSDTNWAAVALGVASGPRLEAVWPRLLKEPGFWLGDMPTQLVTKPFAYEPWEYNEPLSWQVSPLHDVAAMGRVWYLEATACQHMKDTKRLSESVRRVCKAGLKDGGYWRERYHPRPDGTVAPAGAQKYCEYAAILVRVVLGSQEVFCR
jgi:hypothetical protein